MLILRFISLLFCVLSISSSLGLAEENPPLDPWRSGVRIVPVVEHAERHVIHAYFNTCPESPDGRHVVYYTSDTRSGESGDLRLLERHTGKERILASGVTTEDAHRVACQQWSHQGKAVVFHDYDGSRWSVKVFDLESNEIRVLASDRQLGITSPHSPWVPIYGSHWNLSAHRDIELVHVETGEIRKAVTVDRVVEQYGDWIDSVFLTRKISLFFPVLSPGGDKLFLKLARPSGSDDFRHRGASFRQGIIVFDIENDRFVRLIEKWGHPAWMPNGEKIFEKGNWSIDLDTGKRRRHAPSCFSNHPSVSPDGRLFVTDAKIGKRFPDTPNHWGIGVASMEEDAYVLIHAFDNSNGADSWRPSHPHPVFSADGQRIYYNISEGPWTTLMVATAGQGGS